MNPSLSDIIGLAQAGHISLVGESAGYLVLAVADVVVERGLRLEPASIAASMQNLHFRNGEKLSSHSPRDHLWNP